MRICFLGNRGVPAQFGGSDTVFEQLGGRLVKNGHEVVVYCRKQFNTSDEKYYKGMERVVLPSINIRSLDTLAHSIISTIHVLINNKVDILNYHGLGNSLVLPLLILSRKKSVVLIDGPDWKRPKWNLLAKAALRMSVYFAIIFADEIITDNVPMNDWLKLKYGRNTPLIFYGADFEKIPPGNSLLKWGLKGDDYILFVGMMVSDKGPDLILEAYSKIKSDKKLVLIGDVHYRKEYFKYLKKKYENNPNIIFAGFQYGNAYKEFMSNAYIYVHPFRSDGTSPSLIQAMAFGKCILANDTTETKAALNDAGLTFIKDSAQSMAEKLQYLLETPKIVDAYQEKSLKIAKCIYNWDSIVIQYENVFEKISKSSYC